MIKYFVAMFTVLSSSQAIAKCAEQSDIVFYMQEEDQRLHVGWYMPFYYVVTVTEGKDKGLQELRYGSKVIMSSKDSEIHNRYFIHFYDGFKVYSWDDYQRIVYTKGDVQCLEIENDTIK